MSLLPPIETAPRERAAPPLEVQRLDGVGPTLTRIDRHVARARRDAAPLLLLAVALGPVLARDGGNARQHVGELTREFTRRLRAQLRGNDDVWQFTNEDWIAVLPDCRPEFERPVRRRLVTWLGSPFRLSAGLLVTCPRIGVASLSGEVDSAAALLASAQSALDADEVLAAGRRGY